MLILWALCVCRRETKTTHCQGKSVSTTAHLATHFLISALFHSWSLSISVLKKTGWFVLIHESFNKFIVSPGQSALQAFFHWVVWGSKGYTKPEILFLLPKEAGQCLFNLKLYSYQTVHFIQLLEEMKDKILGNAGTED